MDQFIWGTVGTVCDAIRDVDAGKLYSDLCLKADGRSVLYYLIIGFGISVVLGAVGNALTPSRRRRRREDD